MTVVVTSLARSVVESRLGPDFVCWTPEGELVAACFFDDVMRRFPELSVSAVEVLGPWWVGFWGLGRPDGIVYRLTPRPAP